MPSKFATSIVCLLLLGSLHAQHRHDLVFKIGGVYFGDCKVLVGSEGTTLLNTVAWNGAKTEVDMDVFGERGSVVARIRKAELVSGDTARYRIRRDKITFAVWDAQTGRVISLLRPAVPDHPSTKQQINVWLDVYTAHGRSFHCDPEHSDLELMERQRTNSFFGNRIGLELD